MPLSSHAPLSINRTLPLFLILETTCAVLVPRNFPAQHEAARAQEHERGLRDETHAHLRRSAAARAPARHAALVYVLRIEQ